MHKYYDSNEDMTRKNNRILLHLERAKKHNSDGRRPPEYDVGLVYEGRSRLKPGAAGGKDAVVVEMIHLLSPIAVEKVFQLFKARFQGGAGACVENWCTIMMSFLPKEQKSQKMY